MQRPPTANNNSGSGNQQDSGDKSTYSSPDIKQQNANNRPHTGPAQGRPPLHTREEDDGL